MNIAALKCSGGLNLGNNFINFGGQAVLEKLHPDDNIEYFEFLDSTLPQWKNKNEILTPSTISYIQNNFDLIYVFSGSAGSPTMFNFFFRNLDKIGVPFIPIGISCGGQYNQPEIQSINDIANLPNCKKIITRDESTYSYIEDKSNVYSGIDLAFFAKDTIKPRNENSDFNYAIVNFEPGGICSIPETYDLKQQLEETGEYDKVYVVENMVPVSNRDIENYVQFGYADELWNFYANASYVITTRIHSCVCSIVSGVKVTYLGGDQGAVKGRNCLFNEIGLTLKSEEEYDGKDYQENIEEAKSNYISGLQEFLKS